MSTTACVRTSPAPCLRSPSRRSPAVATGTLRVLKIQRTCLHDGPGIRTTIFFQGCSLRCAWCQNPESIATGAETTPGVPDSPADIAELVLRDRHYYRATGGGVTLSGGEPLLQNPAALLPLLKILKRERIPVAVETCLNVPTATIDQVEPLVSPFIVDLKTVGDDALHRRLTGRDSRLIRANIARLTGRGAELRFRMVMVPGHNDTDNLIDAAAAYLKSIGHDSIELLKYHAMGEEKAGRLGISRPALNISDGQAVASIERAIVRFRQQGVAASCHEFSPPPARATFPHRVHAIQRAIRDSGYHLCFEASALKTAYYRENGFDRPAHVHRAERLAHVLKHKRVIVYPDELLVGNFTSKRRGGHVWEEHAGVLLATIVHQIDRQKPVPFECSWRDRLEFYLKTVPFWVKHGLFFKVYDSLAGFVPAFARYSELATGFNNNMASIAHFIVNYRRLLENGTTGLIAEVERQRREHPDKNPDFYRGAVIALEGLEAFAGRYADELARLAGEEADPVRRRELEQMSAICRRVPKFPARTFHEALQSMLFLHIALCTETFENAISPGRLDQILYPYYASDKAAGLIDYERARELLALFILKMDEAILVNDGDTYLRIGRLFETMSTDQTVTAGGVDSDGRDATNDLTWALLDICELQPYAVNMTARIHPGSPPAYLERLAEVYINGSPMPALYNDEVYVETLCRHYDTTREEARDYAIVGCVEPNASDDHFGNTDCANINVALPLLQALTGDESDLWLPDRPEQVEKIVTKLVDYTLAGRQGRLPRRLHAAYGAIRNSLVRARARRPDPPSSMEELLNRFQRRLNSLARSILADHQRIEAAIAKDFPTPLTSSLSRGCLESGRDVNEGGARHNSSGIQAVGITDVADSLHAIDQVVFRRRLCTIDELIRALETDFEDERGRHIRQLLLDVPKFGEDGSPEAVAWVNRTLQAYVDALAQVPGCPRNGIYAAGYYALNVSDVYGKKTPALPSGRKKGIPLANSVAPHYGMPAADLLSSLNAVAGVDFARYAPNGTTVTFTIDVGLFQGPDGVRNLAGIFATFFRQGGMQFQPNVISRQILLDAYEHPEKYPWLLVRVAGYCAYFNHLSDDLKKIIINRTCYR